MDPVSLLGYAAALFVAAVSPGPGVAAILARVLGRGAPGAVAFTAGLAIGDIVWLGFAVLGLAVIAQTFQWVFLAIKYAGAAYLLYLAWRLWTTPATGVRVAPAGDGRERTGRLFLAGLAVTMGNPKTMIFYVALLPNLLDLRQITLLGFIALAAITLSVLTIVFGGYIMLAARARRLFTTPRAVRLVNRCTGAVMGGAAIAIATR